MASSPKAVEMKRRILVLCTGNSARSQMAEGLFRQKAGDSVEVFSAGTKPKGINPLAIEVMKEIGIDISGHQSKDVSAFQGEKFDAVITVCDNAKESCPVFPGSKMIHWSLNDPEDIAAFRMIRDDLNHRIDDFLSKQS
jgi:arsenate reductase (thioredoxin)